MNISKGTFFFILAVLLGSAMAELVSQNPNLVGPPSHKLHTLSDVHAQVAESFDANNLAIKGYVQNNCDRSIFVQYAWCCTEERRRRGETCADGLLELKPGTGYWTSGGCRNDHCSQTIRIYRDRSARDVYQVEYIMDPNGRVWYNLSAVDGNPFGDKKRYFEIRGRKTCEWMYCAPGQDSKHCDWPYKEGDCEAGDVMFYLC
ncbi:hypothetical protein M011DRAFT_478568 [Sporormia fimetaria CBS 119925]|uniref:Secreted protein n=1 Tax=Sporormia fimetaria CBS 119925 TaxID=1340428 RepID=A0A6A6V7W8_9PLEO|nr:hypothetical protein M011DRAFT_478568 [Sporormia fimetaria CBS 119925]